MSKKITLCILSALPFAFHYAHAEENDSLPITAQVSGFSPSGDQSLGINGLAFSVDGKDYGCTSSSSSRIPNEKIDNVQGKLLDLGYFSGPRTYKLVRSYERIDLITDDTANTTFLTLQDPRLGNYNYEVHTFCGANQTYVSTNASVFTIKGGGQKYITTYVFTIPYDTKKIVTCNSFPSSSIPFLSLTVEGAIANIDPALYSSSSLQAMRVIGYGNKDGSKYGSLTIGSYDHYFLMQGAAQFPPGTSDFSYQLSCQVGTKS